MQVERAIIKKVPLFARLSDEEIQRLSDIIVVRGCLAGVPLFEAGDSSDAFYIISRGSVRIQLPGEPDKNILLHRGEFFGEMGVIRGNPRCADAFVQEDSVLLQIGREDFDRLMAIDQGLAEKIISAFIERVNEGEAAKPDPVKEEGGYVPPERACRVISVFSPSGGAGTTSLACSMAVKAREFTSKRVLVVDADLQLGAVHLAFGAKPKADTAELVRESEIGGLSLSKYITPLHYGIDILPAPLQAHDAVDIPSATWKTVVNNVADLYDYVFIDMSSALSDLNMKLFGLSDDIIMVVTPEVITVNRVCMALDFLARKKLSTERVKLLLNRERSEGVIRRKDIEERFEGKIFGAVTFDPASVTDALNEGLPLVRRTPKVQASIDISRACRQLLCLPSVQENVPKEKAFSLWNMFG